MNEVSGPPAPVRLSFSHNYDNHQLVYPLDNELLIDFRVRSSQNPPRKIIRVLDCDMEPKRYIRFLQLLSQGNECWIYDGPHTHNGYGSFGVGGRQGKQLRAHKLAHALWKGSINNGLQCLHVKECEFRSCCRPLHLYTGTAKQNTTDMMEKGNHKYKSNNVVTHEMVDQMRYYKSKGFSLIEIGDRVGVSNETVRVYLNGTVSVNLPRIVRNG